MSNVPLDRTTAQRQSVPQSPRIRSASRMPMPVAVSYRDGAVLTFLFDRSTTIVDLATLIARAGTVRKVVL